MALSLCRVTESWGFIVLLGKWGLCCFRVRPIVWCRVHRMCSFLVPGTSLCVHSYLGLRSGYCQCRILPLLQGLEKNPARKVQCKVVPTYQRNNKKLYKVTNGCLRGWGERVKGLQCSVSISKKGAQSPFLVSKCLWFFWHLLRTKSWCVFRVVNRDKWIPCLNSDECWGKLPRKGQRGAGTAKICRTRAEQVEKESAESWPAPALCGYCLQHDPSLSRASLHRSKMETCEVLWTRMTLNWVQYFVFCRHLFAVGRGTYCT